jgi:uncharacterized protein YbaR (Trm112 family)
MIFKEHLAVLACPGCKGDLVHSDESSLICLHCRLSYPVIVGIPIMLTNEANNIEEQELRGKGF